MPITPFLRNQAFDPETVVAMSEAFQGACQALGLTDRNDPLNELVAKRVIDLAQMGVRSSADLYMRTLQEFRSNAA
jgi:hypothetical protein